MPSLFPDLNPLIADYGDEGNACGVSVQVLGFVLFLEVRRGLRA